eukprot:1658837-Pyramimonas_sp.AAC.1
MRSGQRGGTGQYRQLHGAGAEDGNAPRAQAAQGGAEVRSTAALGAGEAAAGSAESEASNV